MAASSFLPYARPVIEDDDIAAVIDVLRSGWLTTGPQVEAFEADLQQATGAQHAIACATGTAALHLVCLGLGLGPGDAAVVPSVTFLATANAVTFTGAEVIFADVDPKTGRMTPDTFAEALDRAGDNAKVAFNVHLAGPCERAADFAAIAQERGVSLVDDACHALGGTYDDPSGPRRVGDNAYAQASCFSFHAVKTIAMGEGGAVTTNDPVLAEAVKRLRNHGMTRSPEAFTQTAEAFEQNGEGRRWYYEMATPGFNYRVSDIHCALGRSQLRKLDRFVAKRAALKGAYDAALAERLPHVRRPTASPGVRPAWHLYPVAIDFAELGFTRSQVMASLAAQGVGAQVHYIPVHRQPYYRQRNPGLRLPGADRYYARTLSLPLFPALELEQVGHVVEALAVALGADAVVGLGR